MFYRGEKISISVLPESHLYVGLGILWLKSQSPARMPPGLGRLTWVIPRAVASFASTNQSSVVTRRLWNHTVVSFFGQYPT